jgi:hypothetical protein
VTGEKDEEGKEKMDEEGIENTEGTGKGG